MIANINKPITEKLSILLAMLFVCILLIANIISNVENENIMMAYLSILVLTFSCVSGILRIIKITIITATGTLISNSQYHVPLKLINNLPIFGLYLDYIPFITTNPPSMLPCFSLV